MSLKGKRCFGLVYGASHLTTLPPLSSSPTAQLQDSLHLDNAVLQRRGLLCTMLCSVEFSRRSRQHSPLIVSVYNMYEDTLERSGTNSVTFQPNGRPKRFTGCPGHTWTCDYYEDSYLRFGCTSQMNMQVYHPSRVKATSQFHHRIYQANVRRSRCRIQNTPKPTSPSVLPQPMFRRLVEDQKDSRVSFTTYRNNSKHWSSTL